MSNRPFFILGIICALCSSQALMAASPPGDIVGKVMCGYQGWFSCVGDSSPNGGWSHYAPSGTPGSTNIAIVSWPDMRDYTASYQTAFSNLNNGQPAKLYSPWNQQAVNMHFQWMQQNGIDGAALQRFGSWLTPGSSRKSQVDGIAGRVKSAAETYGRKFYIMYDCSATDAVVADWTNTIINTLHLTNSPSYAYQNGKPVVCLWGVMKSGRGTASDWINTINALKAQGCYVIGGVLHIWTGDTAANGAVYSACDAITPWVIGPMSDMASVDSFYNNHVVPDVAYCNSHGLDYQLGVAPGGLQLHRRLHGDFMWKQFYNGIRGGTHGIYIAMFDEYNEGNQIAKTAENASMIPSDAIGDIAVPLDEDGTVCSSDYYLRLTGDGGKMLKGQIVLTSVRPTSTVLPATIPAVPTNLVATAGNTQIVLNWSVSSGAASYNVKRALVSGGSYTTIATNIGIVNYADFGLANGTTYYYVVSSVNSFGESTNSTEASATPTTVVSGQLTWDANGATAPNPSDGSGNWSDANWWNGGSDQAWLDYRQAIFGAGTPGNYTVTLSASVLASNVTFNTSGYTLTGAALTLSAPPASGTNLMVAGNASATINSSINQGGNALWSIGSGASLNLDGGGFNGVGNFILRGSGTNNITGGTYTPAVWWLQNINIIQSGGSIIPGTGLFIGYSGNCNYTMNDASALLTVAGSSGYNFSVGRGGNSGTFNLQNGTVTVGSGFANVLLGHDAGSTATLNISGGTFTVSSGKAIYINSGANASGGSGTLNISGGTVTTPTIQFGNSASAYNANTLASLTVSGGTLYVGSGGVIANTNTGGLPGNSSINLSGGTIGATANWNSSRPVTLATANGPITFQTADAGNNPFNITLSGILSGTGSLIKTGNGTLTLNGGNTYTGGTTLNAGTLRLTTTNNVSMAYTNNGGNFNLRRATVGGSLPASRFTFGNSSPQLTFDLASLGASLTPVLTNSGNLTMNGNVIVNASNAPVSGTSVLFAYAGTRSGSGNFVAGSIPAGASIIDDTVGQKVSLTYLPAAPLAISSLNYSSGNIGFSGLNGAPFVTYRILSSTNFTDWLPVWTNAFDGSGNFNVTLPTDPAMPALFYRLVMP